jgi:hypothetical protein
MTGRKQLAGGRHFLNDEAAGLSVPEGVGDVVGAGDHVIVIRVADDSEHRWGLVAVSHKRSISPMSSIERTLRLDLAFPDRGQGLLAWERPDTK